MKCNGSKKHLLIQLQGPQDYVRVIRKREAVGERLLHLCPIYVDKGKVFLWWSPPGKGQSLDWRRDGSWELATVKFYSPFSYISTPPKPGFIHRIIPENIALTTSCKFQKKSHSISKICLFYLQNIPGSHSLLPTSTWLPSSLLAPQQLRGHSSTPSPNHSASSSQSKLKLFLIIFLCIIPFNGFSLQLE